MDSVIVSILCGELDSVGTIKRQRGAGFGVQVSGISALVTQVSCFFPTEIECSSWLGIGEVRKTCDVECCIRLCQPACSYGIDYSASLWICLGLVYIG